MTASRSLLLLAAACSADATPAPEPSATTPTVDTGASWLHGDGPRFGFPVAEADAIAARVGVDHDPVVQTGVLAAGICTDYLGRAFPHCYDEHDGSDFLLDGGFPAMDAGSATVIAAWPGTVIETHDGEYDRCHVEGTEISCDGFPMEANLVKLLHDDGWESWYWHLMSGSVAVAVGEVVDCGATLGRIGSSGYSSGPHLHFEVHDPTGAVVDPYAGPYSQPETYWDAQGADDSLPGPGCGG
jgi:murein DD-endopeptidase MepM/ murein hydrolase activator NlpD